MEQTTKTEKVGVFNLTESQSQNIPVKQLDDFQIPPRSKTTPITKEEKRIPKLVGLRTTQERSESRLKL